jgi:hypothetical protein
LVLVFYLFLLILRIGISLEIFSSKWVGLSWSSSILEILLDKSFIIFSISSIFSSVDFPNPEVPACSLKRLVSLVPVSTLDFSLLDAIMFDSISMVSSCIPVRVADLLSLKSRVKSSSKAPAKVTFTAS